MKKQIVKFFITGNFIFFSGGWSSAINAAEFGGVLNMGFDFGGDTLGGFVLTDGSTTKVNAGDGLQISGGVKITNDQNNLEAETTIGWKYSGINNVANASADWTRFPLEILGFYKLKQWRFGGGLVYQLSPTFKEDLNGDKVEANFDNTLGYLVQADFLLGSRGFIAGRFTTIDYSYNGASINGDSIGVYIGAHF